MFKPSNVIVSDKTITIVAWGRRDNDFQQWRMIPVESRAKADQVAAKIVDRKIRRGYLVSSDQQK